MSDYLWDKTGEVDAEAERLEELLSTLRFQPRTFEVPATLPVTVRRAPRAVSHFSRARLAVAASLILAALAGAWLMTTKQRTHDATGGVAVAPSKVETSPQLTPHEVAAATPTVEPQKTAQKNVVQRETYETARDVHRQLRREEVPGGVKRLALLPRHSTVRELNASREEVANARVTPQERDAMEKFMLAMKVTSEKLNYAERQVTELNAKSPQR